MVIGKSSARSELERNEFASLLCLSLVLCFGADHLFSLSLGLLTFKVCIKINTSKNKRELNKISFQCRVDVQ